jgi:hypothetical protein
LSKFPFLCCFLVFPLYHEVLVRNKYELIVVGYVFIQIYNDRRLFFGGGPGIVPNDNFGSVASASPNADRRNSRARGMLHFTCLVRNPRILTQRWHLSSTSHWGYAYSKVE